MANQPLTTRIPVKDRDGRVIDEKEVATYAGLLAKAHEDGLKRITTKLLQIPAPDNGDNAIVEATVETSKGSFAGIGDASTNNVNRRVAAHLIRMAETRAKARALRDAVNIGMVALEELGGEEEDTAPAPAPAPAPTPGKVRPFPAPTERRAPPVPEARRETQAPSRSNGAPKMTENQRRWLFRHLIVERRFPESEAAGVLCRAADVSSLDDITKADASSLIDSWSKEGKDAG